MSETKHTPGPWNVFYKSKYDEWHVSIPIDGSSMKLALFPNGICTDNQEADARLIAAAPEQHEALQATQLLLERLGLESSDEYQRNAAAIAKATGGAA